MKTLYFHPLSSFCWKALIALYECDVAFEPHLLDLMNPAVREEFGKLWPIGKMPVLRDGDETIAEATIVIEYATPQLIPARDAWRVRMWDRFFDLYVNEPVGKIVTDKLRPEGSRDPLGVEQARARLTTAYQTLEERYVPSEMFTLADCAAAPALFYANKLIPLASHSRTATYLARLLERPSVARVIREAEPYFKMFPG
jgi:glutathione S-transferase